MKINGSELVMDDGTEYHAYGGVVGMSEDLKPYYGWDGMVGEFDREAMPERHRKELAEFMIALWQRFAAKGGHEQGR